MCHIFLYNPWFWVIYNPATMQSYIYKCKNNNEIMISVVSVDCLFVLFTVPSQHISICELVYNVMDWFPLSYSSSTFWKFIYNKRRMLNFIISSFILFLYQCIDTWYPYCFILFLLFFQINTVLYLK